MVGHHSVIYFCTKYEFREVYKNVLYKRDRLLNIIIKFIKMNLGTAR